MQLPCLQDKCGKILYHSTLIFSHTRDSILSFRTHRHLLPLPQPPTPHHQPFAAVAPRDAPAALDEARRRIRELEEQVRRLSLCRSLCLFNAGSD